MTGAQQTPGGPSPTAGTPALIDSFNRPISYLRLSVTDRCNLRCVYCMPAGGIALMRHGEVLSYEEMLRVARIAAGAGITKVRITGGEPLVRKGMTDFVAGLNELPALTDISMTTNGILLAAAAGGLRRAGLQRINVSLDTLDPAKYRRITRGGDLDAVLAGLHAARIEGFSPVKVNVVVMAGVNDDEVASFAALTMDRPVHIRFIEFMPVNGQGEWDEGGYVSNTAVMEKIRAVGELAPLPSESGAGPARLYRLRGAQGKIGFISPLSSHFCATCNRLRLTADGKLRTCLFSDTETDLRGPLRSGCSDAGLLGLITQAIRDKPRRHDVLEQSFRKCSRTMSAIGG